MKPLVSLSADHLNVSQQYGRLVSISQPCPGVSLHQFLHSARGLPRFLWESPQDGFAFAGIGAALELMAWGPERFETIRQHAEAVFAHAIIMETGVPLAAPLLSGGFSFRDDFVPDLAWSDFTPAHFILPHYQLVQGRDGPWLTLNAHVPFDENPHTLAAELHAALSSKVAELQAAQASSTVREQTGHLAYPMPFDAWERIIEQARGHIRAGTVQKVVLARIAELECPDPIDIDAVLASLRHSYPTTYRFLFEPRPFRAFLGATPELLAHVRGAELSTIALAGSIRRGATPEDDADLMHQLLDSTKDRIEHQIVIDEIRARLAPLTSALDIAPTDVMTLRNIHHLLTTIKGQLRQQGGILPIIDTLHPTPALGGTPRAAAMELIGQMEPFPRGWYAAPVGWINHRMDGQFSVAIRSAVVQSRRMWLYAGAGIVEESDPRREWDETALKFQPMLNALPFKAAPLS